MVEERAGAPAYDVRTASWPRRALALLVDWVVSTLVVIALVGAESYGQVGGDAQFYVLVVFVVESAVLTALLGGSFGKLMTRLRVVRLDAGGRPPDLLRSLLRQVLVALVVPPLVFKPDGRGLHDLAARSATVPLERRGGAVGPGQGDGAG